jgi:hypothetical protein
MKEVAAAVIASLTHKDLRGGRWEEVHAELHKDHDELLVIVEAKDFYPNEVPLEIKKEIAHVVAKECKGKVSGWSLVFTNRGWQYDGALPNEL